MQLHVLRALKPDLHLSVFRFQRLSGHREGLDDLPEVRFVVLVGEAMDCNL